MWTWIMDELQKIVKALPLHKEYASIEKDDVVQNVVRMLLDNPNLAKDIYDNKKVGVLYVIARREIYDNEAEFYFENKMELSRFQRIRNVCEEYGIEPIPENAYKIFALLEDKNNNFTISGIASLLSRIPVERGALVPINRGLLLTNRDCGGLFDENGIR